MTDQKSKPGQVVGLKVEHTNPEEQLDRLIIQLGEALTSEGLKRTDAVVYTEEAAKCESKAQYLRELLIKIRARDAGQKVEPELSRHGKPKRMQPLLTYQASDVERELKQVEGQAAKFRGDVKRYLNEAQDLRKESDRLQLLIQKCRP